MIIRKMKCKKCNGALFKFRWEYDKKDEMALYLCHSGMGFQLTDAIITCAVCKEESEYELEDFITTEITKEAEE